jgi:thioredoxin-related protein
MKRLSLTIFLFAVTLTGFAAEINFLDNPAWDTVLARAKKENKMIFLDAYATWCGPCKNMDAETYKDQAVAAYYNANFINVKYDMEKGEGKMLAQRFMVTAYPSLLFVDAAGLLLHKGLGFMESEDFVTLGKDAKSPNSQYYTLKKNALNLSAADFAKFSALAIGFQDEELDALAKSYLAKQPDILGNAGLIDLVMRSVSSLPDEKALAYFAKSKDKITAANKYTAEEFDDRLISLALMYSISDAVQTDPNNYDFDRIKKVLDQYVPTKSFFLLNYFKIQHLLEQEKIDEASATLALLFANTPAIVTLDQACNTMMSIGPVLLIAGKLDAALQKFDAIVVPAKDADKAYMKDFVKAIIYVKGKQMDQFKTIANDMLANPKVPQSVKDDLKAALEKVNQ